MKSICYSDGIWADIRERWEHGESASAIARTPDYPSKQAILKRIKRDRWEVVAIELPVGNEGNTISVPADLDPRRKAALETIATGGNFKDAARMAHVCESTFRQWRQDPEFSALCEAAATGLKIEMLDHVRRGAARDPKNAQWMLEHHPMTRQEFGGSNLGGQFIGKNVINVLAGVDVGFTLGPDDSVIEGETES